MTNRERVLTTLGHQQPDRVPYHIDFTQKALARFQAYAGADWLKSLENCLTVFGMDPANTWRETAPDIWEDQFGVQWNRSVDKDIGVVCNTCVTLENVGTYRMPDPDDPSRYQALRDFLAAGKGDRFVVGDIGFSLFERAWTLAGMENVLMAMVADPDFIHTLLDRILAFNLRVIENACRLDIDAMRFGDDWGQQTGLIMGPELWRQFIYPRIRQMYQAVKARKKFVVIHSCGKVQEVFPDLIEAGLDVFNPFQPEVMDPVIMKKQFGRRLVFFGGISTQRLLPFGTVSQVKKEVRELLKVVGESGGYIAAPAHAIPGDAKPENVAAMLDVLQNQ
jgi:uroporphyrinogen decarboxylase